MATPKPYCKFCGGPIESISDIDAGSFGKLDRHGYLPDCIIHLKSQIEALREEIREMKLERDRTSFDAAVRRYKQMVERNHPDE